MIKHILRNTQNYIDTYPKEDRKSKGQFFTSIETARYMAKGVSLKEELSILDMGAGTGILTAAILERILRSKKTKCVTVTFYENDPNILPTLSKNVLIMKQHCAKKNITLNVNIEQENFITHNRCIWEKGGDELYDIVISNPPYKKISINSLESQAMSAIVYGQPNLYCLFMAMGLSMLKQHGDYISIVPRSWTSGLYFSKFRKYLLSNLNVKKLHLFVSRDKVFKQESVLQETMIVFGKKEAKQSTSITIATSEQNDDFHNTKQIKANKKSIVGQNVNQFVYLPSTQEEIQLLRFMSKMNCSLDKLGFCFKTGPVVEFRNDDIISTKDEPGMVPLLRPSHLISGCIRFPVDTKKCQYIKYSDKSVLFNKNKNTILLKRFTTKEDCRRLQPAMVIADDFHHTTYAIENHVNYLVKKDGNINLDELYGIMTIFSSDLWDSYYRILNGNTQVNVSEINSMPMPNRQIICKIGQAARRANSTNYDDIIKEVICD